MILCLKFCKIGIGRETPQKSPLELGQVIFFHGIHGKMATQRKLLSTAWNLPWELIRGSNLPVLGTFSSNSECATLGMQIHPKNLPRLSFSKQSPDKNWLQSSFKISVIQFAVCLCVNARALKLCFAPQACLHTKWNFLFILNTLGEFLSHKMHMKRTKKNPFPCLFCSSGLSSQHNFYCRRM